jgi:hypothetical protein
MRSIDSETSKIQHDESDFLKTPESFQLKRPV